MSKKKPTSASRKRSSRKTATKNAQHKTSHLWLKFALAIAVVLAVGVVYLDATVRYSFMEKQWQLPARVYARPLVFREDKRLHPDDVERELRLLGYAKDSSGRRPGSYHRQANNFSIATRGYTSVMGPVRAERFNVQFTGTRILQIRNASGSTIRRASLEPLLIGSIYPKHREDRLLIKLEEVPASLVEILLLIEDRDFYSHWGLSPRAIARAFMVNMKAGRTLQGGSTITQQVVKNIYLNAERSLWRKGIEAIMALLVELHFSKEEILQNYINEVYLGQEGPKGIHGFALASRHYFNRPLAELNPAQIAMLVGLVKGPSYFDPWRFPERAKERRNIVLQVMQEHELISAQQHQQYSEAALGLAKNSALEGVYPAYLDLVRRQLRRDYSEESLQTEGMRIFTAFDPLLQHHAEQSLSKVLDGQDKSLQGAMVVTDVNTGNVVAVVGGRRMRFAGFNRALDAVRPIGSLIKPAVYLTALQHSQQYTLATPLSDGPVEVAGRDGSVWAPRNFDRTSHGTVLLHQALAHSYNQATARLGMEVGLSNVLSVVERLGIQRELPALPSMLLGTAELSPLEVAVMYQTIASGGLHSPLRSIINIADSEGVAMAQYPMDRYQAIDYPLMHLLHYAMLEVVREGTGKGVYQWLPEDYKVAGKTGTTSDLRDSWFAGFAGDHLAVVWMGRDDNGSAGLTGSSGALKVWGGFMRSASHFPLDFTAPAGVAYHWVDSETGLLSREVCEGARYMPFLQGSAPTQKSRCQTSVPKVWDWFKNLF